MKQTADPDMQNNRFINIGYILIPFLLGCLPFIWYAVSGDRDTLNGELGLIELATVFFLLISIILGIIMFRQSTGLSKIIRACFMLFVLGCIYFAGEEASWGQHLFGWSAGEVWSTINNQQETNLHNIHGLFDQIPRFLVGLGIFIGGLLIPILRLFKLANFKDQSILFWLMPGSACILPALFVTVVRPVFLIWDITFISTGEYKEFLIGLFFLVYAVSKSQEIILYKRTQAELAEGSV